MQHHLATEYNNDLGKPIPDVTLRVPSDYSEDRTLDRSDSGKSTDSGFADACRNLSASDDEHSETTEVAEVYDTQRHLKRQPEIIVFTDEFPQKSRQKKGLFLSLSNIPPWKKKHQQNTMTSNDVNQSSDIPRIKLSNSDCFSDHSDIKLQSRDIKLQSGSNLKLSKSTTDIENVDTVDSRLMLQHVSAESSAGSVSSVSSSTQTLCGQDKPARPRSPKPALHKSRSSSRSSSTSSSCDGCSKQVQVLSSNFVGA